MPTQHIADIHATLAIKRSMEVCREEYLDYMTFHANCALKQDGATLSGTCTPAEAPPGGDAPKPSTITAGSVDGQNVKFGYDVSFGDMMFHVDYSGALTSDTAMSGKFSVAGMDGTFTATKQ